MKVRELIEILQKIENKELEVQILPCKEQFAGDYCCYGEAKNVEEKELYLDNELFKEIQNMVESHEDDLEEMFDKSIDEITNEEVEEWVGTYSKIHAVIITVGIHGVKTRMYGLLNSKG